MKQKIILYYKYIAIDQPEAMRLWQRSLCESLNLKGRILIAHEGINGTVGGTDASIDAYVNAMKAHPLFDDVDFKESYAHGECFPKLKVKVRPTIVNLGIDPQVLTSENTGTHLTPTQVHDLISQKPDDLMILDARNLFEARIGKFENAVVPNIETFREFPAFIDNNLEQFKDKQVLMYCTGGVRCERASAYLKSKQVAKEVFQLHGGIHKYIEEYPDGHFRGKNYVFDGRISMSANTDVLGECFSCKTPCNEYSNCINVACNAHCLLCTTCSVILEQTCSPQCQEIIKGQGKSIRTSPAKTACAIPL